jgi:hypothetical protein
LETGKNRGQVISRLFSIKRSYVSLSLEHWRKVSHPQVVRIILSPQFFPVSSIFGSSGRVSEVVQASFIRLLNFTNPVSACHIYHRRIHPFNCLPHPPII